MDNNNLGSNLPPIPQPESQSLPPVVVPKPGGYKNKLIAVIVLVIIATGVSALAYYKSQQNNTAVNSSVNGITVKYINSKLGFANFAQGHYLSSSDPSTGGTPTKLYYDGKVVMDSTTLGGDGYLYRNFISHNGLHYAFVVGHTAQGSFVNYNDLYDLYVDGKKVVSIPHEIDWPAVTDDGQTYFYTRSNATSTDNLTFVPHDLIKNDQVIFTHSIGFHSLQVSDDGSTFLALLENQEVMPYQTEFLSLNGKQMSLAPWGKVSGVLSPNGKHYRVIQNGKLFIDGTAHLASVDWDSYTSLSVTDSGHYVISSSNLGKIFIDDKEYDISPNNSLAVPIMAAYINEDASHYLFFGADGWTLDGKSIDLKGASPSRLYGGVELVGNTIYVYSTGLASPFTKQPATTKAPNTNQTSTVSVEQCKSESTDKQGDCFRNYGKTTKDINACKNIAVYPNDVACAIGVAVALNDVKICDQVSTFLSYEAPQYGVSGCYNGYAAENKDGQICASLSGSNPQLTQFEQDTCYSGIATTSLDDSYCANLSNAYSKDQCYQTIAEKKSDITICDKISDSNAESKGDCYVKIAVATKNPSLCDKITFFPNAQNLCFQSFNITK